MSMYFFTMYLHPKTFYIIMYKVFCEIEIKYITDVKPLACNGCFY